MTQSRSHTFFACVALLPYMLFGAAAAQGLVLCIEADGAINVEAALNGFCYSSQASTRSGLPLQVTRIHANTGEGHCSFCLDNSLPQVAFRSQALPIENGTITPLAFSPAVLIVSASQLRPATNPITLAPRTLPPATSLVALRTVIHLI